jgi:hypothetical protein
LGVLENRVLRRIFRPKREGGRKEGRKEGRKDQEDGKNYVKKSFIIFANSFSPCRRLLEKRIFTRKVKKYPPLYGTRKFITVFTRATPFISILSQMNPVHSLTHCLCKAHYSVILSMISSSEWSLSFRLFEQNFVQIS